MVLERDILKKYILIMFCFFIAEFLVMITNNMIYHIICMIFFSGICVIVSDFDLMHPYTWFSAFFCLYSIGLPVLTCDGNTHLRAIYTKELIEIQLLAMFVILLVIGPKKIEYKILDKKNNTLNLGLFNKILYIGLVMTLLGVAVYLSKSGLGGKASIYENGSSLLLILFRLPLFLTMLYSLLMICDWEKNEHVSLKTIIITGIPLFGITLFSGERDFVFRFLIITVIFLFYIGKLKRFHIFLLAPIGIAILILSDKYKYFLSSGLIHDSSESMISKLFAGEFEAASTNLQIVISQKMSHSLGLERYILDIASAFTTKIQSASSWFSDLFYAGRTVQYGFSIIGEGYVIGGVVGVIFISVIIGALIRFFYKRACKSVYWYATYLYFITVTIYAIRMDLGTILSAIVKQIGLVLFVVLIAEKLSKKDKVRMQ